MQLLVLYNVSLFPNIFGRFPVISIEKNKLKNLRKSANKERFVKNKKFNILMKIPKHIISLL